MNGNGLKMANNRRRELQNSQRLLEQPLNLIELEKSVSRFKRCNPLLFIHGKIPRRLELAVSLFRFDLCRFPNDSFPCHVFIFEMTVAECKTDALRLAFFVGDFRFTRLFEKLL